MTFNCCWTLISFQEGAILICLIPVPGKLNYVEIMCLPACLASKGNIDRKDCLRQWVQSLTPYSQTAEPGASGCGGSGVLWRGEEDERETCEKTPAACKGSLPSNCFLNMCQCKVCSPVSSPSLLFASLHLYPLSIKVYTSRLLPWTGKESCAAVGFFVLWSGGSETLNGAEVSQKPGKMLYSAGKTELICIFCGVAVGGPSGNSVL